MEFSWLAAGLPGQSNSNAEGEGNGTGGLIELALVRSSVGPPWFSQLFARFYCCWKADGIQRDGVLDSLVAGSVPGFGFDVGFVGGEIDG